MADEWMTTEEACAYLHVARRTLYQYIHDGKLPSYQVARKGTIRVKREDLDALLKPRQIQLAGHEVP